MGRGPKVLTVEVECRVCGRALPGTPEGRGYRVRRHHTHPGGPYCSGHGSTCHRPVDP